MRSLRLSSAPSRAARLSKTVSSNESLSSQTITASASEARARPGIFPVASDTTILNEGARLRAALAFQPSLKRPGVVRGVGARRGASVHTSRSARNVSFQSTRPNHTKAALNVSGALNPSDSRTSSEGVAELLTLGASLLRIRGTNGFGSVKSRSQKCVLGNLWQLCSLFMAVQEMLTMAGAWPTKSKTARGYNGSLRASAVLFSKISHALSESENRDGGRNRRQRGSSRGAGYN